MRASRVRSYAHVRGRALLNTCRDGMIHDRQLWRVSIHSAIVRLLAVVRNAIHRSESVCTISSSSVLVAVLSSQVAHAPTQVDIEHNRTRLTAVPLPPAPGHRIRSGRDTQREACRSYDYRLVPSLPGTSGQTTFRASYHRLRGDDT